MTPPTPAYPTHSRDQSADFSTDQLTSGLRDTHISSSADAFAGGSRIDNLQVGQGYPGAAGDEGGYDMEDEIGEGEDEAVHFVLLAEFDIDLGSTISQQYPYPTGTDEQ